MRVQNRMRKNLLKIALVSPLGLTGRPLNAGDEYSQVAMSSVTSPLWDDCMGCFKLSMSFSAP